MKIKSCEIWVQVYCSSETPQEGCVYRVMSMTCVWLVVTGTSRAGGVRWVKGCSTCCPGPAGRGWGVPWGGGYTFGYTSQLIAGEFLPVWFFLLGAQSLLLTYVHVHTGTYTFEPYLTFLVKSCSDTRTSFTSCILSPLVQLLGLHLPGRRASVFDVLEKDTCF